MRTKRMNRSLCLWNFSSLFPGTHRRAIKSTGVLRRLSRLAPNFPYRRGLLALALVVPVTAMAGPAGEQVTAGFATVTRPNSVTTIVNQQTPRAIIDWRSFSIGQQELVRFQQPGTSSIALNRVLGSDPSQIFGRLDANGQVFLVNPSGVLFAPGSQVSVHGLLATTHDIGNDDFLTGRYTLSHHDNPYFDAGVVNQGTLIAGETGYIVLAGDYAENSGVIQARLGKAVLASGNRFTIDLEGDELIGLAVDEASLAGRAGVENLGAITADGGQVVMTARVANELAGTVVNNTGLIQAQSIGEQNGEIILYGGTTGIVSSSGTLDASGRNSGESGGSVRMLGEKVALLDQAVVDVSGTSGGGDVQIGGDFQGRPMQLPLPFAGTAEPLPNAAVTSLGRDTVIRADATENGDGGRVIAWADGATRAHGSITARGGQTGGDGGFVEVSGRGYLDFQAMVDSRAPLGEAGSLLLDPTNITIQAASPDIDGNLTTGDDITAITDLDVAAADYPGANSVITAGALSGLLGGSSVTLAATNDITVNSAISWANAFNLSLDAGNTIAINANITSPMAAATGDITLTAGNLISIGANLALTNSTTPSGLITMTAGAGGIDQYGGTITASQLKMTSAGIVDLPFLNQVTTIAANVTGAGSTFGYEGANGFSIGNVGGMLGVTTNNGNVTIRGYGSNPIQVAENVTAGTGSILLGQAAVGPGGDIDVAATKSVSGGSVQLYASDANGLLTINGTTNASGSVLLNTPGTITVTSTGTVSGPSLTLAADAMTLQAGASISAGGGGTAWLKPYTAGQLIDLGGADSAGTLGLDTNELDTITTTGILRVGSMTAGNLNVSAAIAPANVSTLSLESGGTITQAGAGTINETNLAIKALADVDLATASNLVTNLAANIGDGSNQNRNFKFKNGPALNISANIDGRVGISTAIDANNFDSASPNGVIALTSNFGLTQSAGALLAGKAVYVEGSRVVLTESNPTGVLAGKATGSSAGDLFNYASSNGIQVTTVNGFSGIQSASPEATGVLLAASNAGISQDATAPITATTGLMLNTTGPVNLVSTTNSVGALGTTVGVSSLSFKDVSALTLGISGNGISTTANGPINIYAGGLMTVQDPLNSGTGNLALEAPNIELGVTATAGTTITGGLIKLRASQATTGAISSAAGATSASTITGSIIELEADNFTYPSFAPTLNATNIIDYMTVTDDRNMTISALGGATNTAPWLVIGNNTATDANTTGTITVDTAISRPAGGLLLLAGGGISQTAGITANELATFAGSVNPAATIALTSSNSVANFAAQTGGGAISLTNAVALDIDTITDGVDSANGILSNNGNVTITTSAGNINLLSPISAGTGIVSLQAQGAAITGTGLISANELIVQATTGIGNATPIITAVSALDATNQGTTSSNIQINNTGALNIFYAGQIDTMAGGSVVIDNLGPVTVPAANSGVRTYNGNIAITSQGPLTIEKQVLSDTGNIALMAGAPASANTPDILTINAPVSTTGTISLGGYSVIGSSVPTGSNVFQYVYIPPTPPPTLDQCTADPTLAGCANVLPNIDACTADPTLPGCSTVLPTMDTCILDPMAPGCTAVLPPLTDCTVDPTLPGCTAVLPSVDTCILDPMAPGCTAVLPPLTDCTLNPTLPGCSAVLPSVDSCILDPMAPGCTAVLPPLTDCTLNPTLPGCTAVLPSVDTCIITPMAPGCTAVLPPLTDCTVNPTLPGCTAVLPPLDSCILDPMAPGCTAVLPPLTDCTVNPTLPGCSAVLPSVDTCILDPMAPGCTAVLPPLTDCTVNPTLPGCSAVLPSVDTCILDPMAPGCSTVLPPLTDCTVNPTLPGCTAVLPSVDTCILDPMAPGCTAVLPPLTDCTVNPALLGCSAVLPPMDVCTIDPTAPGCTAVLPPMDTCLANPTLPGCATVLPVVINELPTIDDCATNPTAPGCVTVLQVVDTCLADPTAPGCVTLLPPIMESTTTMISSILVEVDTTMPLPGAASGNMPGETAGPAGGGTGGGSAGSGGGSANGENGERRTGEVPVTETSREIPLARQPIFDLGSGGVAGQNMVCR